MIIYDEICGPIGMVQRVETVWPKPFGLPRGWQYVRLKIFVGNLA